MSSEELDNDSTSDSDYYKNLEILLEEQQDIIEELKEEIDKLNFKIGNLKSILFEKINDIINNI